MGRTGDDFGGSLSEVIDGILGKLHQYYVYPEAVPRLEAVVRQHLNNGAYDGIGSGPALADLLTAHLREASQDKHFRVRYSVESQPVVD
jgi:hypothetical protein